MSTHTVEIILARLYSDIQARESFLADAAQFLLAYELSESERSALIAIDRAGLLMAADSYAHKRASHRKPPRSRWTQWWHNLRLWFRRRVQRL